MKSLLSHGIRHTSDWYYSRVSISLCRGVGRHARLLCFKFLDCRPDPRASPFVAGILFCVEPRAIMRAVQVVCKYMELACLFCDFAITRFSVGEVVEVVRAIAHDILHKFLLVDFYCFHSAHGRFDPATVGRTGVPRLTCFTRLRGRHSPTVSCAVCSRSGTRTRNLVLGRTALTD